MSKLAELEQKLQEITAEIEKLKNPNSKARSWDRVEKQDYNMIETHSVTQMTDDNGKFDEIRFKVANYNTDKAYMERIKFEQDLWRKLKRFADQNNEGDLTFNNKNGLDGYPIYYDYSLKQIYVDSRYRICRHFGQVYFTSKEIAEKAIETFKTELLEYFGG